jgi:transglutaminase-like putative cysteine protease
MRRLPQLPPTRFRAIDVLVLIAAAVLLVQAPLSVVDAGWVPNLEPLPKLAVAGLLIGYLIERTRLPGPLGLPLGILLGFEAVTYTFAAVHTARTLAERVDWLGGRVGGWVDTIASGGVSNDPLVFAVAMGGLAWLLGLVTAWLLFRDNAPWLAIVFNAVALLMNLSYAPQTLITYVTWYAFSACLLLTAQQLANRTELWRRAQLHVPWRIVANVLVGTALAVGGVLSVAWALPVNVASPAVASGFGRFMGPWIGMEAEFDRWFAALNGSSRNARGLSFGRTLAPRGAFDLGDTPVLQVKASAPLYLRATTADRYAGQAITSSETMTSEFEPNSDLLPEELIPAARVAVQAQIKVLASRTAVAFTPDAPLRFNVPIQLDTRGTPDDIAAVRLSTPVQQNQEFSVAAAVSTATVQELRAAGEIYPDWVRQRYLQLPRRMERRVIDLARQVAAGSTDPFSKAIAIEQYLRDTYAYSTHVESVPTDRDWIDYFLFDAREGYCDYFATAMVVLLRIDGVPARVASGFAPGEFDESTGISTVRENHAHTWVEAYFPRYGWVTFEPSSIRPLPTRVEEPLEPMPIAMPDTDELADRSGLTREELDELLGFGDESSLVLPPQPFLSTVPGILLMVLAGMLVVALLVAGVLAIIWRQGMRGLAEYQQPYVQLLRLGSWFGTLRATPANTPFEVADQLGRQVPGARPAIHELTAVYVEGTYADRTPPANPWPTWLRARPDVLRGLWRRRLRRWFGEDGSAATAPRSHPELLRQWGASRSVPKRSGKPRLER